MLLSIFFTVVAGILQHNDHEGPPRESGSLFRRLSDLGSSLSRPSSATDPEPLETRLQNAACLHLFVNKFSRTAYLPLAHTGQNWPDMSGFKTCFGIHNEDFDVAFDLLVSNYDVLVRSLSDLQSLNKQLTSRILIFADGFQNKGTLGTAARSQLLDDPLINRFEATRNVLDSYPLQLDLLWAVAVATPETEEDREDIRGFSNVRPSSSSENERNTAMETMDMVLSIASGIMMADPQFLPVICEMMLKYCKFLDLDKLDFENDHAKIMEFLTCKETNYDLFSLWKDAVRKRLIRASM